MVTLLTMFEVVKGQGVVTLTPEGQVVSQGSVVVASVGGGDVKSKPAMVSNSTQTDDGLQEEEKPFILSGMFLAVAAACVSILTIIIFAIIIICVIRCYWDRPRNDPGIFPVNGPYGSVGGKDGSTTYVPVLMDRKMAQSAQMFFYQFQKQQILAKDKENTTRRSVDSDSCSETDIKDGHVNIVSCPGLALDSGEDIEVRNPLFADIPDVPTTPTWNESSHNDSHNDSNNGSQPETLPNTDEENSHDVDDATHMTSSAPVISPPPPSISSLSDYNTSLPSPSISPLPALRDDDNDEGRGDSVNTSKNSEDADDGERKDGNDGRAVSGDGNAGFSKNSEKSSQMKSIIAEEKESEFKPPNGSSLR
ncbi:hypothetical protein HELRODRAFT_165702 [Helobdella robusta]|uniref:Uncharacterized protein n=1 Tax=Helobdella robusta TaxID=6412 RepID=T1EX69_HELRO|nr:hypothetical protein HELRODRAFT_165702 [Helobdella robusta]ESN91649.1 hypothetical protein HELRODRAFT_165702 [Helobdella robusta]